MYAVASTSRRVLTKHLFRQRRKTWRALPSDDASAFIKGHAFLSTQSSDGEIETNLGAALDPSNVETLTKSFDTLSNVWPPDLVVHAVSYLNTGVGLEWYQAIILSTVATRFALAPFAVYLMKGASRLARVGPHLQPLSEQYKAGKISAEEFQRRVKVIYDKNGISNPLKPILAPFLQFPIFISYFVGLRQLPEYCDVTSGGALWFNDLSVCDPYYVLPVTTALGFWLAFELNADGTNSNQSMPQMKIIMRVLAASMIPITASFPAALLVYWNTNNLFSLCQVAVLKIPGVKPALGILPPPEKPNAGVATVTSQAGASDAGVSATIKDRADVLSSPPSAVDQSNSKSKVGKATRRKRRRAGRRRG